MDIRIYRPTGLMKYYEEWVKKSRSISFVIHNHRLGRTYDIIFITRRFIDACIYWSETYNKDLDDVIVDQLVKTISHEAMHLAISEIEDIDASMKYDAITGGECDDKQSSGGTWDREDILP